MELLPFDGGTYVVPRMNWKLEGLVSVITNAASIFIDKLANAVRLVESVTTTVNEYVFVLLAAGSVPLIKPDDDRLRPTGNEEPLCSDQL
jgi:hypothetical protein